MMQRARIEILRLRRFSGDTSFDVFGDLGTGSIDFDHPLTPRPVALWPEAAPRDGHLMDGHLRARHLDDVNPDGHLDGPHLRAEHLFPAVSVSLDTPRYVFGRFLHAIKTYDRAGNASAATVAAMTVNSAPSLPEKLTRGTHDALTDRLTFDFRPSRFESAGGK